MSDRSRWDPEMRAYQAEAEAIAAKFPPVKLELPLEPHRAVNDAISLARGARGPEMAETTERWVAARGRRIYCRVHRPRTDRRAAGAGVFPRRRLGLGLGRHARFGGARRSPRGAKSPSSASITRCHRRRSFRRRWRNAPPWCAMSRARAQPGGSIRHGSCSAAIRRAATSLWRPRCCCATPAGQGSPGIVTAYPVCDSSFETPSYREFATGHVLTREKMAFYWSVYVPHEADRTHPLAAPLRADLTGLPPVLILLAELDVLRSEGEALAAKLREAAVPVELEVYPGVLHGFLRATEGVQKARDAVAKAGAWLRRIVQ